MTEPERLCTVCIPLRWTRKQREQGNGPNPHPVESGYSCPSCAVALAAVPKDIAESFGWLGWALLRPESGKRGDGRAASPDPALPFPVDAHDLAANHGAPRGPIALARLAENADLQVGYPPVAATLWNHVRVWVDVRGKGEAGPEPTVPAICDWLSVRTAWACEEFPAVDEYALEVVQLRGALYGIAGHPEPDDRPVPVAGVPCIRCRHVSLVRRPADMAILCQWPDCMSVWTPDEWARVTKATAQAVRRGQIKREDAPA